MEFLKIAWRNMGRNLRRTVIIMVAIALGVWGGLMAIALDNSFAYQMVDSFINANLGHLQVHQFGYHRNPSLRLCMTNGDELMARIAATPHVAGASPRITAFALAQSPRASQGVMILGIDPALEPEVTHIKDFVKDGAYFSGPDEPAVLIGKDLAHKLDVGVGDKVAFFTQSFQSEESVVESFRIKGIYSTGITDLDKMLVFLPIGQARRVLEMDGRVNEIAIRVDDERNLDLVKNELREERSDHPPELKIMEGQGGTDSNRFPLLTVSSGQVGELLTAPEALGESFKLNPAVDAMSFRLSLPVSTSRGQARPLALDLYGVEPVNENRISGIFDRIEIPDGSWLQGTEKDKELEANHDWVVLSQTAAAALGARAGDSVTFRSGDKSLTLEVAGTTRTGLGGSGDFAIMGRHQMWETFLAQSSASEIAVRLKPNADAKKMGQELRAGLVLEILDWKELWPILAQMTSIIEYANYILLICIYIVVAFGIANTMIMSVFERVRELGILKAIGTRPAQLFGMVILESVMLSVLGLLLGGLVSGATYWFWARNGLDLSMFAEGLAAYGMPSILYPTLTLENILSAVILAVAIAILSSIYPAVRASRLLVVEAIRRI